MAEIRVGTTGYRYDIWSGHFYPSDLPDEQRLGYYCQHFNILEYTDSFDKWPSVAQAINLKRALANDCLVDIQAARVLTHKKALYRPESWIAKLAGTWHVLGDRAGVLRFAIPSENPRDDARLEYFLAHKPNWLTVAFEFENPSWHDERIFSLLSEYQVGLVISSQDGTRNQMHTTSDLVYLRLHGPDGAPDSPYSDAELHWWAQAITNWQDQGKDVHCFFVNAGTANSVLDALRLKQILGQR